MSKRTSVTENASCTKKSRQKESQPTRRSRSASVTLASCANDTGETTSMRRPRNASATVSYIYENDSEDEAERRSRNTLAKALSRANKTEEETLRRRSRDASARAKSRRNETEDETSIRRSRDAAAAALSRANETEEETLTRRARDASVRAVSRANETEEETSRRREAAATQSSRQRQTQRQKRQEEYRCLYGAAINYAKNHNYETDRVYDIGQMNRKCRFCQAYKWQGESPGMCCLNGKVCLPELREPPGVLKSLLMNTHPDSKHYNTNIRAYNSAFQMTSFAAQQVREHGWMPTFKVQGQVYHRIGSVNNDADMNPQCLQIYFVNDRDNQADMRMSYIPQLNRNIILELQDMLHANNNYIQSFKCAKDKLVDEDMKLVIRADKTPAGEHERRFNAPSTNEVAVLLTGQPHTRRDIVVEQRNNTLKSVSYTNRAYDSLQYPLLLPYGEDGYQFKLKQTNPATGQNTNKDISAKSYYAYRLMQRDEEVNVLLQSKQLSHQYIVDMYAKVESERLCYLASKQDKLRVDNYRELHDAVHVHDGNTDNVGKLTILPSSFTGGPRYMHMRTQDAMVYVRKFGCPDYFVTFTCNSKWVEITRELKPGDTTTQRHDLIARVFKLKLDNLMDLIKKHQVFGKVRCHIYTIEWQKRGLPHAHILLWMYDKLRGEEIDAAISAELPDVNEDPILHNIITSTMIHGPCGDMNRNAPCMRDGKCTKRYPKKFCKDTISDQDGYPLYRRRSPEDGGKTATIKLKREDVIIDNRWVVPHNSYLSRIFNAHINVECCSSIRSIKYVCKYINKGTDMAVFTLQRDSDNNLNEIQIFQFGRYISTNEGAWRILGFNIHDRYPSVQHLQVHLENGQRVYFTEATAQHAATEPPPTTLTAFFELCSVDEFAKTLLYNELPKYYTITAAKKWKRRAIGEAVPDHPGVKSTDTLGRVYTVHPDNEECFHLRLLLHTVRGPTSFEHLKTVDGEVCGTFRESCNMRGLLEDDTLWDQTMNEATVGDSPKRLRYLFAMIIHNCTVSDPLQLWHNYKDAMSEDFAYAEGLDTPDDNIYNAVLLYIEDRLLSFPNGKTNEKKGLPVPDRGNDTMPSNELRREKNYNEQEMRQIVEERQNTLTPDQQNAYHQIRQVIEANNGGLLFLDAPGGTGKTYLLNLLLAEVRAKKQIAIAVASSGIAATLLRGGRTAHSTFKLPLNLATQECPTCEITRQSATATLLRECKLIVWDECTMSHKHAFEAVDRTLRDLTTVNKPMGGKVVLLTGDFRQTLPVIPRGTRADLICASLKASYLWPSFVSFTLMTNMRAHLYGDIGADEFASHLLRVGNGEIEEHEDGYITIPQGGGNIVETANDLKECIYPNLKDNVQNREWLCERAILAPRNDAVNDINEQLMMEMPGESVEYRSIDTVPDLDNTVEYPTEFLNSLDISGMPPHKLELKVGMPIILLRNLDPPRLCNGTRLIVLQLMNRLIEGQISSGQCEGERVYIPRIPLKPTDCPFEFKRLQFPIRICFAMTINRSQGQSLKVAGLSLANTCFSHGQFYVGCSRVGSPSNLHILCEEGQTKNVVYKEALK